MNHAWFVFRLDIYEYLIHPMQVWSNLVCYETIPEPYSKTKTNNELFSALEPVSEYVWRARFSAEAGKLTGGMLLHEWLQAFQDAAEFWSHCNAKPEDLQCQGALPNRSMVGLVKHCGAL